MRPRTRRPRLLLLGLGLAAVVLSAAACGGGSSTSTANTSATTAGGTAASGTAAGGGTVVTVGETEFKLALSTSSFSPGAYTFKAVNNGKIVHSLEITGPGVQATTPDLQPGQSAELHVNLQDGSYDVFCPIDSHKSLGMNAEITVGTGVAGSGAQSTTPTTPSTVPSSGGGGVSY
jgi:plastocyanin